MPFKKIFFWYNIKKKLLNILCHQKKNFFFWYNIKERLILPKKHLKTVDSVNTLQLNERHIGEQLGYKNLHSVTSKYGKIYKKCRYELVHEPTKQPYRNFLRIDLAKKIIMDCKTDESSNLKRNLGFKLHDVINTKEQTIINSIKDTFEGENIQTQYSVLGYRIDLYFHKYKLAIKVNELGHNDRNIDYEIQRQQALER